MRLNPEKAAGKKMVMNLTFTDLGKSYALVVENGTLNYEERLLPNADVTINTTKATMDSVQLGETTLEKAAQSGDLQLGGSEQVLRDFMAMLDTYPFWFNIVTP